MHKDPIPTACIIDGQSCNNCCNYPHNYYHLIGASDSPTGTGKSNASSDFCFIFVNAIESDTNTYCQTHTCTGNEAPNYIRQTSAHEIAHLFRINQCNEPVSHDANNAWCGNAGGSCLSNDPICVPPVPGQMVEWCIMNGTILPEDLAFCQRSNGIDRFDCSDLSAHYISGQPSCSESDCTCPPSDPNCQNKISIRTDIDPE